MSYRRSPLVLHTVILHKPEFTSRQEAAYWVLDHFPNEDIKTVEETTPSFHVVLYPETVFEKTAYVSKRVNSYLTLVFGKDAA